MARKDDTAKLLTEFVLQFDEETQELWMRLFELYTKQALTEQEAEEFETLCSKLRLASAEVSVDPWPMEAIYKVRNAGFWP